MKRVLISFLMIGFLASCGNNNTETTTAPDDTASNNSSSTQPATTEQVDPDIEKGLDLIASSDCLTCHKVDEPLVGPTYKSVAAKYKDSSPSIVDTLANRVIKGSMGHWGQVPMTPHPNLSVDDVKMMVKYVLSLK